MWSDVSSECWTVLADTCLNEPVIRFLNNQKGKHHSELLLLQHIAPANEHTDVHV